MLRSLHTFVLLRVITSVGRTFGNGYFCHFAPVLEPRHIRTRPKNVSFLPQVSTEAEAPYSTSVLLRTDTICASLHFQHPIFSTKNPRQLPWFHHSSVSHRHVRISQPKIRNHCNLLLHRKSNLWIVLPPWNLHVLHTRKCEHHTCINANKNQPSATNHKP